MDPTTTKTFFNRETMPRLESTNIQQPQRKYLSNPSRTAKYDLFPRIELPTNKSKLSLLFPEIKHGQQIINYDKLNKMIQQKHNGSSIPLHNGLLKPKRYKEFKNATALARNKHINHFDHIMPKLYNHLKDISTQLAFSKPKFQQIIPQLQQSKILDDYRIISHVGKGCFSVVSAAVNKVNNHRCAIKTYNRIDQMDDIKLKNLQSEVENLFNLKHQNIISLQHAVKDGKKIQLIMENGGKQSLSGLLRKTTTFQEPVAKKYFKQIVEALAYCHSQNICHRDIKLENMLVDDNGKVKLIDFGFSIKCNNKTRLTSYCGTPPYMSPQLAARCPYNGHTSDVWALGVSLYLMLNGKFPFKAGNQKQLYRLIQQGKYKSNENLSLQARNLLSAMLKVDENNRITAEQIINSEWLKNT